MPLFVILYRKNTGAITYKFISDKVEEAYDKFAPFSFKKIREKVKELDKTITEQDLINNTFLIIKRGKKNYYIAKKI